MLMVPSFPALGVKVTVQVPAERVQVPATGVNVPEPLGLWENVTVPPVGVIAVPPLVSAHCRSAGGRLVDSD